MKMTYFQDTDTLYLEFNTIFKKGDQGTIVEYLPPKEQQSEAGYLLSVICYLLSVIGYRVIVLSCYRLSPRNV